MTEAGLPQDTGAETAAGRHTAITVHSEIKLLGDFFLFLCVHLFTESGIVTEKAGDPSRLTSTERGLEGAHGVSLLLQKISTKHLEINTFFSFQILHLKSTLVLKEKCFYSPVSILKSVTCLHGVSL